MTEVTKAKTEIKEVEVKVGKDLSTATLNGTKVEISPEGNVVVFTNEAVQTKPAATATAAAATEDKQISIGKDFNTVAMYGVTVELAADGSLIVSTNGKVQIKPAVANDAAAAQVALVLGQEMPDHSIYAGLTADGKQQIFAMPKDIDVMLTFNGAAECVYGLNAAKALGHRDWQVPAHDDLHVLQKNQNEGKLKGTFSTTDKRSGSNGTDCPGWYWSSPENRGTSSCLDSIRFSDGGEGCNHMGYPRMSCRPVRLVAAP